MKQLAFFFFIILSLVSTVICQKIKADELITKHVDSLAAAEVRQKGRKDLSLIGTVGYTAGTTNDVGSSGSAAFAFEVEKSAFAFTLGAKSYDHDRFIYDGKKLRIDNPITGGNRSALGNFLSTNEGLVKSGLFGGVYNGAWALGDSANPRGKLSDIGLKKLDGIDVYVASFSPKKGLGLNIKMYFDKENFRHIRTEYSRMIGAQMGATPETSSQQAEEFETLIEEFGDFKTVNGWSLPQSYKVTLLVERARRASEFRYKFNFDQIYIDQTLDPTTFSTNW